MTSSQSKDQRDADSTPKSARFKIPLENEICYFGLASAMDFFVTYILLQFKQFRESNGLANFVLEQFGTTGMAVFKVAIVIFVVVIAVIVEGKRKNSGRYLLIFGTVLVSGVVVYGVSLYVRYSGFY